MTETSQVLHAYAAILRRRRIHFLLPAMLVFGVALVLAFTLPSIYRSTATLLIERQEIPSDLIASTVTGYAAEQIQTISQQVMTHDNLWQIAEDFDLFAGERDPSASYEIVTRMRESITMEMVSEDVVDPRSGKPREVTIAFAVSYDSESPEVARDVTARLAELYLDENRRSRTRQAESTSVFLAGEADKLRASVTELEAKLAEFKRQNSGLLPEFAALNRQALERAQQQHLEAEAAIRALESRRAVLQTQLAEVQSGYEQQLNTLRAELAAARQRYSEIHPDVVRLKRALATLEAEQRSGRPASPPVVQNSTALAEVRAEYDSINANLNAQRVQLKKLESDIADYESRLSRGPEVEREYLALNRDYQNAVSKYDEIKGKQMQAQLSEELERAQKGERLSLLEAPRLPREPIKPNRLGVALLGFMLALMTGVGVAGIAEFRDHTIHEASELAAILRTQPIGIIPVIESDQGLAKKVRAA